jgi:hypothetical protein
VDKRVKPAVGWRPGGHGLQTAADLPAVNEVPAS